MEDLLILKGSNGACFALAPRFEVFVGDLVDCGDGMLRKVIDVIPAQSDVMRILAHTGNEAQIAVEAWSSRSLVKEDTDDS
jgi:hypothetical protein